MRKAISLAALGSIVLLAMALAGASSAAGPQTAPAGAQVAAPSKARAIGPGFVRQLGKRNYAGPNCPGAGWNCTSSTRVFQAASPGGQNVVDCTPGATISGQSCDITQTSGTNVAKCTLKSGDASVSQSCTIKQTGVSNSAAVTQYISSTTTGTQDGTQSASIEQKPAVGGTTAFNLAKVTQSVSQNTRAAGEQKQNAHQKALVTQTAAGAGYNLSDVNQSQLQKANGGAPQGQNANESNSADCLDGPPLAPNACSEIVQHSASGTNASTLNQSIDQDAKTSVLGANQTQGTFGGGLEGHVHQDTVSGSSLNKAKQDKHQNMNGPANASQTQFDPVRCCGDFSQFGGSGNVEDINQSSSINASSPVADQHSTLIGESRTPDGSCTINQRAAIDTDATSNSVALSPCPLVTLTTSCSSGGIDIDAVFRGDNCTSFAPEIGQPESSLNKLVRNGDASYADSTTAATGDTVDFRITYSNAGDVDAHSVTVTDVVPAGLTFGGCQPSPCSYNSDDNTVTWDVGTVAYGAGGSVDLFFQAEVLEDTSGVTITNTANASSKEEGPGAASDSATVTVLNAPQSSLSLQVRNLTDGGTFGTTAVADVTDTLEYQIVYSNSGGPAHGVTTGGFGDIPTNSSLVDGIDLGGGLFTSFVCPGPLSTTTCTLGLAPDYGTVESDTPAGARTVRLTVSPTTFCTTMSFTATGSTTEEGTFQSNSTSVGVTGCPG